MVLIDQINNFQQLFHTFVWFIPFLPIFLLSFFPLSISPVFITATSVVGYYIGTGYNTGVGTGTNPGIGTSTGNGTGGNDTSDGSATGTATATVTVTMPT